jgi:rare lipoprotein A
LLALALAWLLAACGSAPQRTGGDGPAADTPANLMAVPNAVPRVEPLRVGGPNKPYQIRGVSYRPLTSDQPLRERGLASWYGRKFHGRPTANGETYDMFAMTAAHKTMPLPSYARVRNPANGREIIVRVNDRGPFHEGRIIDLSYTAALKLDVLGGVAPVEVERLTHAEIRAGVRPPAAPDDDPSELAEGSPGAGPGYWIQLGAFRDRDGALQLQRLLQNEAAWLAPQVALVDESPWVRVQAGPWASRAQAEAMASRLAQALPLEPFVLRRP